MFFSKQSPATSGKLALQQDVSHASSSSSLIITPASSLAATLAVPAPAAKSGLFSKWQQTSRTSSASCVPLNTQPSIAELLKKNSALLDQVGGFMQVNELNRLAKHKLAEDLEAREHECAQLRDSTLALTSQLECSKHDHQDQTSKLQAELLCLTASRDETATKQASLQQENESLATHIATAEHKVKQYELGTNTLKQQMQSYVALSNQQQQSSKAQVDAMHAQQLRTEQRTEQQLKAKDAVIRDLQAQLKQQETAATKIIVSREDEIAVMQVQLKRFVMDCDSLAQQADQWQDYGNVHRVRVDKLEEQLVQLNAQSS